MYPSFIVQQVATTTSQISSELVGALGYILTIFAALVGLGIALKYVRKWIGSPAGTTTIDLDARNRLFAAQIHNSELLERGDKVLTIEELSR